jgi:hypothetical protein
MSSSVKIYGWSTSTSKAIQIPYFVTIPWIPARLGSGAMRLIQLQ